MLLYQITSNWREWYYFRHQQECFKSGQAFEDYVTRVLSRYHDDFINPDPVGSLGDGGCDGLAEAGTIFYACYGQRPGRNAERELTTKIRSDLERGLGKWATFHTWRFVTNARVGPNAVQQFTQLQREHGEEATRPLTMRIMKSDDLWTNIVQTLDLEILNNLFPGAPGVENIELADLLPLLDRLGNTDLTVDCSIGSVRPVSADKMDFNSIPEASRMEFNSGRRIAPEIDYWYAESSDPSLYDQHGAKFKDLYYGARETTDSPIEILERLYVAVAGQNFRMDAKKANAAFAVVAYFFDSCHIFESPTDSDLPTASRIGVPNVPTY